VTLQAGKENRRLDESHKDALMARTVAATRDPNRTYITTPLIIAQVSISARKLAAKRFLKRN